MTVAGRAGRVVGPVQPGTGQQGQAAVELALVLPLVALLVLALVQAGLLVRDQIRVVHAAREAARAVAVEAEPDAARRAATSSSALDASRLQVSVTGRGEPGSRAEVTARYRAPTDVPLVGGLVGDLTLESRASMRVES